MPSLPVPHARPALVTRALGLAMIPLAAVLLASCGPRDEDRFAPACPVPSIPRDIGDLKRFRGAGRDITDSIIEGRVVGVKGSCTRDGPGTVVASLTIGIELTRGPAAPGRIADIPYIVAVSDGDIILDKRVYTLRATFPANTERLRLAGDEVELRLPITPAKTAAAYRVSVGFQLTPEELATNRMPRR